MTEILPEDDVIGRPYDQAKQNIWEIPSVEPYPLHDLDLPIHKAAYKGDTAQVTSLIASGVDVNACGVIDECTPLQLAIRGNQAETVRILLSAGADPALLDSIEPCYYAPFDAINGAAWLGAHHALGALLDFGVDVPSAALYWAASLNRAECVRAILEKLGQNDFSDVPRSQGLSAALNRAALCWHVEVVELVLVHVERILAEPGSEDRTYLSTALVEAARYYDCDDRCRQDLDKQLLVMQKLIKAGADVNWEPDPEEPWGAAFWASLDDCYVPTKAIRLLLDSGLQLDKTDGLGSTPLFGIISRSRDDDGEGNDDDGLVKAFLEAGAKATVTDNGLNTPLHGASRRSYAEVLFAHGADLFARNRDGETPFHAACEHACMHVVEFLLSHGASVSDPSTAKQWTPLLFATNLTQFHWPERNKRVIALLLARGADVTATAADDLTVLHHVAHIGDVDLVRTMIEHEADVCAVTSIGETALHAVCDLSDAYESDKAPRLAIIHMLLEHGADINARDKTGSTPLHVSWSSTQYTSRFSPEVFNLLVEKGADRLATNNDMKTPVDLVNSAQWIFDENGLAREKPKLV